MEGSGLRLTPLLVRTNEQLNACVEHVRQHDSFVVDVETDGLNPAINTVLWVGLATNEQVFTIPMGHPKGRMLAAPSSEKRLPPEPERNVLKDGSLSKAKKEYRIPAVFADPGPQLRADAVFTALEPLFYGTQTKINHNLKFDLESVAKYYGGAIAPGPYQDTIPLLHILDENLTSYKLKDVVPEWLRVAKNPKVRQAFYPDLGSKGVTNFGIDEVARYLAKDVWFTRIFYEEHLPLLDEEGLRLAYEIEMALYPSIMSMELSGMRLDLPLLQQHGEVLRQERDKLAWQIYDICGEEYPLTNVNRKRFFLFAPANQGGQGLLPLTFTAKTHTAQVNTALLEFYAPTNDLCRLLLEWTGKDKVISTFVDGLIAKTARGRLHTGFKQHGTVTGRLSSAAPNLQQIPRGDGIRSSFVADPGHRLVVADYDQIELRCAAYLSEDVEMIRVFREGIDIHTQAAAAMYQIALEDVGEERQVGKTMNFGTLYGAGPTKISTVASTIRPCDIPQAQEFIRRYYEQFAGLSQWKYDEVRAARRNRRNGGIPYTLIPPFGRKRRLPDLFAMDDGLKKRAERQVVNAIVQGFAAYVMKLAMIDLHLTLIDVPEIQMLLQVHDEVIFQAPEEMVEETKNLVVKVMESVLHNGGPILGSDIPLAVKGGIGMTWSGAK